MKLSRRQALALPFALGVTPLIGKPKPTDIRIEEIRFAFEDWRYRAPYKFGGVQVDRATLLNVNCTVRTRSGKTAKGFGSMPLGNVWSFPSRTLGYDGTLAAMRALADRIATATRGWTR